MKLLVLRQHTGGVGAAISGEAVIKVAQSLVSGELTKLLDDSAVSCSRMAMATCGPSAVCTTWSTCKCLHAPGPPCRLSLVHLTS